MENGAHILHRWLPGDLETPVSAYLKLCGGRPPGFLLESVEGGEVLGRYSVIGCDADLLWRCRGPVAEISRDGRAWERQNAPPIDSLKTLLRACRVENVPEGLPPMAASGLFGALGYAMARLAEETLPDAHADDTGLPDGLLMRPRLLAVFDNVKNRICLIAPAYGASERPAASRLLRNAEKRLAKPLKRTLLDRKTRLQTPLAVSSTMTESQYRAAVEKAREHIRAGDIFQAVLGQRFSFPFDLPSIALYRSLRALNPSPFMVHMDFGGFALVASSPEILVRVRGGTVTIRPIAGTRPRGANPEEDEALAAELLADPKERAEHLMLLDLGRNDVGRVADYGSVRVSQKFAVERYSHVMHIVSNVEGRLKAGLDIIDAHFAGFPAGTVTGAPKIRAMQIIDALEKNRRGFYGGSIGYFSGNGEMDTCIALRTAVLCNGMAHVQAGAGVVADSDPASEYRETVNKAGALIAAAEAALDLAARRKRHRS